ncbi:TyrR/PhhR family helix-turn-helix DNA-binding protein [Aliagarivorans taiwanensis]|uniref:TyrR/PhhR family helix-turn-helix DNA-binding protein n=1 Tax=Aliagarivorans taiwanensis TaxID=561966 RepID=UPI00040A96C2|nr:TyrR/PhhR family helix-turn-helix DNA-binding protein [Aliagarivorans taiwanensis]
MRIELACQHSTEVFGLVISLLKKHQLTLMAMQTAADERLYLQIDDLDTPLTQTLLSELRCISGINDARIVAALPSEIENREVQILLDNVPYPVVLIDKSGLIRQFNHSFEHACGDGEGCLLEQDINRYLRGFSIGRWFGNGAGKRELHELQLNGQHYLVDIIPLADSQLQANQPGAIMLFKSAEWLDQGFDLSQIERELSEGSLVATSAEMRSILSSLKRLVDHPMPSLLFGEAGVGKRFLAELLNEISGGSAQRFVCFDCRKRKGELLSALAEIVAEQPLTVLLHNVDQLTNQEVEAALNELSQPQHGVLHILVASRLSPEQLASLWGDSRYYDLVKNSIAIPALRSRREDIVPLAEAWLNRHFAKHQELAPPLTKEVKRFLSSQSWPGNIPQLYQVLQESLNGAQLKRWQVSDVKYHHGSLAENVNIESLLEQDYHSAMGQFEHLLLSYHFPQYPSSRLLAKKLGISHTAIANKLREHNIRNSRSEN